METFRKLKSEMEALRNGNDQKKMHMFSNQYNIEMELSTLRNEHLNTIPTETFLCAKTLPFSDTSFSGSQLYSLCFFKHIVFRISALQLVFFKHILFKHVIFQKSL